jgi:predicted RNase H-like nuclease (RuvC/YqgF family)
MPNGQLAQRVDTLEEYMKDLSFQALRTERELARLSQEMREFKDEMKVFKDEMGAFKDEMRVFKDEMGAFKDEMKDFKDEMKDFKDEMGTFKTQAELDRREMNRRWGELANKMGTLVEDIVSPNLPRVARELFGCEEPQWTSVRMKRRAGSKTAEIDALVVCEGVVLVNETKSTLYRRDVDDLLAKLEGLGEFFPDLAQRRFVGVIASLYVDDDIVQHATRKGVLVMGMKDDTMSILNPEAVVR